MVAVDGGGSSGPVEVAYDYLYMYHRLSFLRQDKCSQEISRVCVCVCDGLSLGMPIYA